MERYKYKIKINELGKIGSVPRWTRSAIDCYERHCVCIGCPMKDLIKSSKCQMKASVMELVRLYGIPKKETAQF